MADTEIRRHLSAVRSLVLAIISENQPMSPESIAAEWASRHPELAARHRSALPRMTGQILWRLENLEWVRRQHDAIVLTDLGMRALRIGPRDL
ncbi:hypothetical protein [Microbacterium sp.]|uniref:hypothetical protein n=1 Tax=Microbacterium sp. TaxID=51671 RepID=UPI003F6E8588